MGKKKKAKFMPGSKFAKNMFLCCQGRIFSHLFPHSFPPHFTTMFFAGNICN